MFKKKILLGLLLSALIIPSCVNDLYEAPIDPNRILSGNISDDPDYVKGALGKIYASFFLAGQGTGFSADISSSDDNFFTTLRAYWNLQEITTDEAMCAWGDVGIADLNTQTWSPSNPFLTAVYQRLGLSITYANDFITLTKDNTDPDIMRYNAEARFLRALAYSYYLDLFGNPPFVTEEQGVGIFYPEQIQRADLFSYVISELHAIKNELGEPGFSYPQADQGAAWMLLARLYLNAEVYTGTAQWDSCRVYASKVITEGGYELASDYRQNFSADNDGIQNPEMIFSWDHDGIYTQGYIGTTFIIESSSDDTYIMAQTYHGLTTNPNWNGNRARKDFLNVMIDTLATYGGTAIPATDTIFAASPDKRVLFRQKRSMNIPSASSSGYYGVGVYKFTARNHDGTLPTNYNTAYACTDFPVFRLADAYMMRAEAYHNLGSDDLAADDINVIRERAYGDQSGNIEAADVTDQFILDERGREFYYEAQRRTDLIRFGQYTNGDYVWQWKGGVYEGVSTGSFRNLFPIPGDEIAANPNMEQNTGY